jgi:hypothetical protein
VNNGECLITVHIFSLGRILGQSLTSKQSLN